MTRHQAELELLNTLADVRRGLWQPPDREDASASFSPEPEPSFHEFASRWYAAREAEGVAPRTLEDDKWALSTHLLPFFKNHRLEQITPAEVDRYKTGKVQERARIDAERDQALVKGERYRDRGLSNRSINHTISVLSAVLEQAADYGLVATNAAAGKRRRFEGGAATPAVGRPRAADEPARSGTGAEEPPRRPRPASARDARRRRLAHRRGAVAATAARQPRERNVDGRAVEDGRWCPVVDVPPALRDELASYLDEFVPREPSAFVFGTSRGGKENPSNVRNRLFVPAIVEANKRLAQLGIEQLGPVRPHGLRRTYASLRMMCGDDPVYVSQQIGHEDVRFTLNVYAQSVKRRERMTQAERREYDRAVEWARWAAMGSNSLDDVLVLTAEETENPA